MSGIEFFQPPGENDVTNLLIAIGIAVAIYLLPFLLEPFDAFFTMIHELGHVYATRATGGIVSGFWIFSNMSGQTKLKEGSDFFINPAGYLGVSLFTAGLILMTGRPDLAQYTLSILGGFIFLLLLLYGKQHRIDERRVITAIVALGAATALIGIAWLAPQRWSVLTLYLLAILGIFFSLSHIEELAQEVRIRPAETDAAHMAALIRSRPMLWVWIWYILSVIILAAAFWFTWVRHWVNF